MKDNNTRVNFGDGTAQREDSSNKTRPDLISPFAMKRLGEWARKGGAKYGDWNWAKGMPFSRYTQSMHRHLLEWEAGDKSEDNLSAIAWNALAIIHHEELNELEWDDMPKFNKKEASNGKI